MVNRFSLYDFIAVIVPGIFLMWALGSAAGIEALRGTVPLTGGITETSVLIVVGYVVGLLLQALSQQITEGLLLRVWGGFPSARWLLPDDARFSMHYKAELAGALRTRFGIDLAGESANRGSREDQLKRNQEIFYRCYRSVEKLTELPQTFVAQYGLFRALLTTFSLLVLVSIWRALVAYRSVGFVDYQGLLGIGIWAFATVLCYRRVTKRGEDFAKAVFDAFLAHAGPSGKAAD